MGARAELSSPRRIGVALALAVCLLVEASYATAGVTKHHRRSPPPLVPVSATVVEREIANGEPVTRSYELLEGTLKIPSSARAAITLTDVTVKGGLHLPSELHAPLTLNHVTLKGPLSGGSVTFDDVIDVQYSKLFGGATLTGAVFRGPAIFTGITAYAPLHFDFATFNGIALFPNAIINRHAYFTGTQFEGVARFTGADFARSNFNSSWFGDIAEFSGTRFVAKALFSAVEFRSVADFAGAQFSDGASFRASRFSSIGDFSRTLFAAPGGPQTSFVAARFDQGANFLDTYFGNQAAFDRVNSSGDLQFDGATFRNGATFTASRLLGDTTFHGSAVDGPLNFDGGYINEIDLDGATLRDEPGQVTLPNNHLNKPNQNVPKVASYLGALRFDPSDLNALALSAKDRESALALMQSAALRGGDEQAANQAQYDRWTLLRHGRETFLRAGDWILMWGIGGYLVRPWHQVVVLALLLLLATIIRRHQTPLIAWRGQRWRELQRIRRDLRRQFRLRCKFAVMPSVPALAGAEQAASPPMPHASSSSTEVPPPRSPTPSQTSSARHQLDPPGEGAAATEGTGDHTSSRPPQAARSYSWSFVDSFRAIWHFRVAGRPAAVVEGLAYKVVFLVLLFNLANVWPLGHDLLKGVLPF